MSAHQALYLEAEVAVKDYLDGLRTGRIPVTRPSFIQVNVMPHIARELLREETETP